VTRAAPTRRRILDAAVRRIAAEGIDDVRIARIAMDAGVSAALLHYHFASREALLVEALEHSFELVGDVRIPEAPGEVPSATDRLRAMIDLCLPVPGAQRDDFVLWAELWLRAARRPELAEVAGRLYARLHAWVLEVLADGVAAGEIVVDDPARATDRLLALIDGYGLRALIGDPAMPLERAREELWDAMVRDLGVPPAARSA
jgi:AcrR family transcriptional regulator